jgi:putative oxidoreductase
MAGISALRRGIVSLLDNLHSVFSPLGLRLLLAYEYWDSGVMKFKGENWFGDIQDQFPFPFNLIPPDLSWHLATYMEMIGAIALLVGLGTRFISFSLIVLTVVAWAAVHAGNGYNVCENGWQLPLFYLVMFVPLALGGAGKLSLDHWFFSRK